MFTNPIFVGSILEHRLFTASYLPVEYQETKDILALAQVIAGASVLISNQTCAWWIGAGAGIPVIQESYLNDLNSVINRPNLFYSRSASEINDLLSKITASEIDNLFSKLMSKVYLRQNNELAIIQPS